ncbi:MAG: hypothetical protein NTV52_11880 [Acidobacteria bacterium]|nr:hypothetical protein [Acidobacteriota bacterium]
MQLTFRFLIPLVLAAAAFGQQARVLGTVQSAVPTLEVKTDKGELLKVGLADKATIRKVAPGAKDLSGAQTVSLDDLASGDRVLLRGAQTGADFSAESIILMSSREITQKNQAETAEWTKRGISGLVDKVDPTTNSITVMVRATEGTKPVKVTLAEKTDVKRYAKDSVKYSSAQASKLSEIKKGDQLRAMGAKSEDGATVAAERIIYGTFRSAAGVITAINAETKEVTVKDWQSSKPMMIQLSADTTVKKMPNFGGMGGGMGGPPGGGRPQGMPAGGPPAGGPPAGMGGMRPPGGFDPSQMIERLPAVSFADLAVGDTIMIASTPTDKPDRLIAITVVGGAERILTMLAAQAQAGAAGAAAGAMRGGMGGMGGGAGGLDAIMGMPGIQ